MSIFRKLLEGAKAAKAIQGDVRVAVKLKGDDGSTATLTGKSAATELGEGIEGFATALRKSETVKMAEKSVFAKSEGRLAVDVSGKYASQAFLAHENAEETEEQADAA